MYIKYGIGITNLAISNLRSEQVYIRGFLEDLNQSETENVCMVTSQQMDEYFRAEQLREVKEETYNKKVMCILHFFNYLKVKGHIERIPFDPDYYIKKTFQQHHDRSVEQEVMDEIMANLYKFSEDTRLMFLHLWGIGLRLSEVCTLKGNAYYMQGHDAWIQVYQIKMRTYKRIPIPMALYKLMKVYIAKYNRKADEYIFQNQKGGAYHKGTFKNKMIKACKECNVQNGEYIFRSHDYRHTIATAFYDTGVPIQSIRDYLGHDYEEMTRQYVDFMPRLMVIHQMLGTRISDTLTLETDCLYEKGIDTIIRIRQMKTSTYEKPVSAELAALIRKAIAYTQERFGETQYIFVNENNPNKPMQYGTIQSRIVKMIREQNIRDDNGNLFGFGSHLYRHYYGVKLTEMHLDDWTIAKLLGHSNLKNVKYYRKMSNQILADDTRKARKRLSDIILQNLDGWGDEYEQIRQDGGM